MALQRNLKAMGTFGYQTTTRQNPVYIQYMPRTLRYVRDTLRATRASRRLHELLVPVHRRAALIRSPCRPTSKTSRRHVGETITLKGWLHNRRSSGKLHFLTVRDGTGFIQAVMSKAAVGAEVFVSADHLGQESVDRRHRRGPRRRARAGRLSSSTSAASRSSSQAHDYPITPKEHGVDFLMDRRHLWIRAPRQQAILRVRHEVIDACRDFFDSRGFILADTPIFTPSACEGTTTLFPVQYFEDTTAYLTQSGQLYNEANAMALGRVYAFGPTFRAEKSKTRRHLTEFWMVEPEMAYASLDDTMDLAEDLIVSVVSRVLDKRAARAEGARARHVEARSGPAAVPAHHLRRRGRQAARRRPAVRVGRRLRRHRRDGDLAAVRPPGVLHRYPSAIKAFYMKPDPERPEVALGVDVLAPEGYGEIIGGGERLADYDLLLQRIEEHKLPKEAFDWYLDLRRYGSVPHAGFGMGIERVRRLDLRPRARARDDPVSAHAVPAVSLSAARPGRSRRRQSALPKEVGCLDANDGGDGCDVWAAGHAGGGRAELDTHVRGLRQSTPGIVLPTVVSREKPSTRGARWTPTSPATPPST